MPRDGSGVFSVPPGTSASPNTTILSAPYNAFLADLEADLNAARPVTAGGTGLTTLGSKEQILRVNAAGNALEYSSYAPYPSGHLYGLTLSNGTDATNDINVAVGTCRSSDDTTNIDISTAMGKQVDVAWALGGTTGTPAGGRFHSSLSDGTLHFYAIKNPSTGVCDSGFSDNANDPTGGGNYPTGYTKYRRIGSLLRESSTLIPFLQVGDHFYRDMITDVNATTVNNELRTLSVPTGITVGALFTASLRRDATTLAVLFMPPAKDFGPPSSTRGHLVVTASVTSADGTFTVHTNTSRQIRTKSSTGSSVTVSELSIHTAGWVDTRGRLA